MPHSDPEMRRSYNKAYREKHRDRLRAAAAVTGKAWRKENPDKVRASKRRYLSKNTVKTLAYERLAYARNPELRKAAARQRRARNPDKVHAENRAWRTSNPGQVLANILKRRFRLQQRTPRWVNMDEMNRIYLACPSGMVVDHIVPLVGITVEGYRVSGLNVAWNLSYLTPTENSRKGNRMRPEDHAVVGAAIGENPVPEQLSLWDD